MLEDDAFQENVVQTHSQLTKKPPKESKKKNERVRNVQSSLCPFSSKVPNKSDTSIRTHNSSNMSYNIIDNIHKMQVALPIMEVMKIPNKRRIGSKL